MSGHPRSTRRLRQNHIGRTYEQFHQPRKEAVGLIEPLESRVMLSNAAPIDSERLVASLAYLPPRASLVNQAGFLTGPNAGAPLDAAKAFLTANAAAFGADAQSIAQAKVTDQYTDADSGVTHIYLRQRINGLEVANANLSIHLTRANEVITAAGGFVAGYSTPQAAAALPNPATPRRDAAQAALDAAAQLGYAIQAPPRVIQPANGVGLRTVLSSADLSNEDVPAELRYVATAAGVRLAWGLVLRTPDGEHWYDAGVDSDTGKLTSLSDWMAHADTPESYNIIARPAENPTSGRRSVVVNPADPIASPHGWHDTNGGDGAEFTDTRGNNVSAQEDVDANNAGGFRPNGGSGLDFQFPLDATQEPAYYNSAAISNLFYWNNLLHDIHYRYGFNEVSGNFQVNNYARGGRGADAVQADAQDGSGLDNANFGTPPDGQAPRMQMYLFDLTTPQRDGDFDSGIMIHEYGHGVSTRLTGGPSNSDSLDSLQSGGMGEGWSDWWSLMFTQKPTDNANTRRPVGTYALGQAASGDGIRRRPYSFSKTTNPLTFALYGTEGTVGGINRSVEVHDSGELWCSALWDMNWLLIDKYGFGTDIAHGYSPTTPGRNGGNNLALRLVMDALKMQPANPSFIEARDAILLADEALNGGADKLQIWQAFARRGLGVAASTEDGNSLSLVTSTSIPSTAGLTDTQVVAASPSAAQSTPVDHVDLRFNVDMDQSSFSIEDDLVSFTAPGGADLKGQVTGFSWVNSTTLRLTFNPVAGAGGYSMVVGPGISSLANAIPMDQDADGSPGEATEDRFAAQFLLGSPAVTASAPTGAGFTPQGFIDFTFNRPMNPDSFSIADDVTRFTGPGGVDLASQITGFEWQNDNTALHLTFNAQSSAGAYFLTLGSQIISAGGEALDQDGDFNLGETAEDGYTASFSLVAPKVVSSSPSGRRIDGFGLFDFTFNQPMDLSSFSLDSDIVSFVNSSGDLRDQIVGFSWVNGNRTLRIRTTQLARRGEYAMTIGPDIRSPLGFAMDQDEDKNLSESNDDTYTANVTIAPALGPEGFGYIAIRAPLQNIDLVAGQPGVVKLLDNEDDAATSLPLGNNIFRFYGQPHTGSNQMFVSTNGLITFGTPEDLPININLTFFPQEAAIAPYWDDLQTDVGTASAVLYRFDDTDGDGTSDRLIIEWNNVPHFDNVGGATVQAILQLNTGATSGDIIFNYPDIDFGNSIFNGGGTATVGIKDEGTQGDRRLLVSFYNSAGPYVVNRKAVRLTYDKAAPTAQIAAVDPDPRTDPVDSISISFNEPVSGFGLSDLTLTRDGEPVALAGAKLTSNDDQLWTLSNLASLTSQPGAYQLKLTAAGSRIKDDANNSMTADAIEEWTVTPSDTSPHVTDVFVGGSTWNAAFLQFLAANQLGSADFGYHLGQGAEATTALPWSDIDRVVIRFDADVTVAQANLAVTGADSSPYVFAGFTYDPATFTAAWTFGENIGADRLQLNLADVVSAGGLTALDGDYAGSLPSGDGAAGGDFSFTLNVLPADVDRSGSVNASDLVKTRNRVGRSAATPGEGESAYSPFADVNASGVIDAADLVLVRNRIGLSTPPAVRSFEFSQSRIDHDHSIDRLREEDVLA